MNGVTRFTFELFISRFLLLSSSLCLVILAFSRFLVLSMFDDSRLLIILTLLRYFHHDLPTAAAFRSFPSPKRPIFGCIILACDTIIRNLVLFEGLAL
jgi:hypothetical protein